MIKALQFNTPYKSGQQVRYTDWHAGHYFHTIERHIITFLDDKHLIWFQEIITDAGGGNHITKFEGVYTLDNSWQMLKAELYYEKDKKILSGSFSVDPNTIVLDIASYRNSDLIENKPYCFSLNKPLSG